MRFDEGCLRLLTSLLIALCIALPCRTAAESSAVQLRFVRPHAINHLIKPLDNYDNVYVPPATAARKRLFLFLPGTWAPPRAYTGILRQAARNGYHAIALDYPNLTEIISYCDHSSDPSCWGRYRNAVINGDTSGTTVRIDVSNSLTQRLIDMLRYADAHYPGEGWGQYLVAGRPLWGRISVGGHSQGAGDAAFLGVLHEMERVCMIEGPADGNRTIPVAAWLANPRQTSSTRTFGFLNRDDRFVAYDRIIKNWTALGVQGPQAQVDASEPPYNGAHELYTVQKRELRLRSHDLVVMDPSTPRTKDGSYLFGPVWQYACFP